MVANSWHPQILFGHLSFADYSAAHECSIVQSTFNCVQCRRVKTSTVFVWLDCTQTLLSPVLYSCIWNKMEGFFLDRYI